MWEHERTAENISSVFKNYGLNITKEKKTSCKQTFLIFLLILGSGTNEHLKTDRCEIKYVNNPSSYLKIIKKILIRWLTPFWVNHLVIKISITIKKNLGGISKKLRFLKLKNIIKILK